MLTKYLASSALAFKILLNLQSVIHDDAHDGDDDEDNDDGSRPQAAAVDNFLLFHSLLLHPNAEIFPRCRKLQLISCEAKAKSVVLETFCNLTLRTLAYTRAVTLWLSQTHTQIHTHTNLISKTLKLVKLRSADTNKTAPNVNKQIYLLMGGERLRSLAFRYIRSVVLGFSLS